MRTSIHQVLYRLRNLPTKRLRVSSLVILPRTTRDVYRARSVVAIARAEMQTVASGGEDHVGECVHSVPALADAKGLDVEVVATEGVRTCTELASVIYPDVLD